MESHSWDEIDRQLVHALVIVPRAPFRVLGDVIGVSDQTIARRYRRLAATAGLRVIGVLNGGRLGWVDWFVRLQATPGGADAIADALARRPDTRWVTLASGGTEITCSLQARTPEERNDLFLRGLPGSRRVTQMTAQSILRIFSGVEWGGLASTMSPAQVAALRDAAVAGGPAPAGTGGPRGGDSPDREAREEVTLRPDDELLLAELSRDGRATHAALAAATHWHESTVRRRIEELQELGLLYFDVDTSEAFLGVQAPALLWLEVDPAHLEATGQAIAGHPEIPFAAATTGTTNLAASALFRETRHMYDYLTTRLPSLPGIRSVETAPVIRRVKQVGALGRTGLPGQRGGSAPELGAADVGLLALAVARGVAVARVGDAGLPGAGIGLPHRAPDGHRPVGQHQRRGWPAVPGRGPLGVRRLRRPLLGLPDPGHHGGRVAEHPRAPPRLDAGCAGRDVRGGQRAGHLNQQRGEQDVSPLDVGCIAEHVQPAPRCPPVQQHALAAQRGGQPGQQVRLDRGPWVVEVEDPVGGGVAAGVERAEQGAVNAIARHELGRLRGQRLGLGRGHPVAGGLGEQLADSIQQLSGGISAHRSLRLVGFELSG
jgi:DNA-binding Lrp family transcriptional regulator